MGRMEHRFGTRRAVQGEVLLHPRAGARPVTALMRDVSISGMLVETPPEQFAGNHVIEIELTLPGDVGLRTWRWPAMVVRKDSRGVGLMFDRVRPPGIMRLMANLDSGLPGRVSATPVAGAAMTPPPASGKSPQA